MALVNGHPVFARNYFTRLDFSKNFAQKQGVKVPDNISQSVYNSLVNEEKNSQIAHKNKIFLSSKEINDEFQRQVQNNDQAGGSSFADMLKGYDITEGFYKKNIIGPRLILDKLNIWYNKQTDLNKFAYDTAASLKTKIEKGENFEGLAKKFSQDQASSLVEGDLGFVEIPKLLPELQEQLDGVKPGELKLIPSRFGLHLIKVVETDNNGPQNSSRVHLQQIFIKTTGFDDWLLNEQSKIKVKQIVKV